LGDNPEAGKNFSHVREGCRRSKVKSHLVFYRIVEGADEIEIVRVLHQQMDIPNRLND
jgi:toxin ParE1/3/4